jgi:soluble lytic murein transglycosylase
MPVTAKHVCRDYKVKCEIPRLLTDKAYNAMIASAYIADRMGEFQGSYVLGTAGYNAGPGRARQWMREFGDPRDPKVDVIDWIYRIPFEETREYVQKVLANTQIYRARLGTPEAALRIGEDLARARGASRAADVVKPTADEVFEKPARAAESGGVREP